MSTELINDTIRIIERSNTSGYLQELAKDVRNGLGTKRKELSPKYFYDERGSRLFEDICELPEYYQTRTERAILQQISPALSRQHQIHALAEFGSGNSSKTRVLLSALQQAGTLQRYIPIDVSSEILLKTAGQLVEEYPGMEVHAVIGDFNDGLPPEATELSCLGMFLGGTIGNLRHKESVEFLGRIAGSMTDNDLFLLGTDLVKPPAMLHAAYNDSQGVTAEFNLNVLHVINRELGGTFNPDLFAHYAFYNPWEEQIEMHLYSATQQTVEISGINMNVELEKGETILTEISRKFTRKSVDAMYEQSGMEMVSWFTDPYELFALSLARRAR